MSKEILRHVSFTIPFSGQQVPISSLDTLLFCPCFLLGSSCPPGKGLMSRIYKELKIPSNKKLNNSTLRWLNDLDKDSSDDT